MTRDVKIGVLALQGDFAAHLAVLRAVGADASEVRRCSELGRVHGLVMPGGESTTLLRLMGDEPWFEALRRFHESGGAIFGTCAGAILLSRKVLNPEQPSLGILDAVIERNAYGRQRESFETRLAVPALATTVQGVFIRAPRFRSLGAQTEVLSTFEGEAVLVRQERILAATFHPELTAEGRLHRYFAGLAGGRVAIPARAVASP